MENVGPSFSYSPRCSAITRHSRISHLNIDPGLTSLSLQLTLFSSREDTGLDDL